MKLKTLIKRLEKIEKKYGENVNVHVRNYNGCMSSLKTVKPTYKGVGLYLDAAQ